VSRSSRDKVFFDERGTECQCSLVHFSYRIGGAAISHVAGVLAAGDGRYIEPTVPDDLAQSGCTFSSVTLVAPSIWP
jgi:hypothetical protein